MRAGYWQRLWRVKDGRRAAVGLVGRDAELARAVSLLEGAESGRADGFR